MVVVSGNPANYNLSTGLGEDTVDERIADLESDLQSLQLQVHPFDSHITVNGVRYVYPSAPTRVRLGDNYSEWTAVTTGETSGMLEVDGGI
eukprot:9952949-Prorocentrum_lima.AAC.1